MRIGIDANCWANTRGYGRYTRELVSALVAIDTKNEYTLFLDSQTERQCDDLPAVPRIVVPTVSAAVDGASASGHRSLADLWSMSRAVSQRRAALDLFYFPSVYTFFPVPSALKPLVTIHDTIAEKHPELIFPHWSNRLFWTIKVRWALHQASLILTVSQTAKSDVIRQFRLADEQVTVISDAVGPQFTPLVDAPHAKRVLSPHGLEPGERFVLYVGGISPHKRIDTLVDAYCAMVTEQPFSDLRLVLIGDYKRDVFYSSYDALRRRITQALGTGHASHRIVFTGFIPDVDLPTWYRAAQALVLPSVDEGFGLPVIEAMACGTPVVVSRAGALPEIVGDAGLLFEPGSVDSLAHSLRSLLMNSEAHRAWAARGLQQAATYSWRASAEAAMAAFADVAGRT